MQVLSHFFLYLRNWRKFLHGSYLGLAMSLLGQWGSCGGLHPLQLDGSLNATILTCGSTLFGSSWRLRSAICPWEKGLLLVNLQMIVDDY